jgi:dipeptidyl aminopeptidase/acylaminoacyl peptidase
MPPKSARRSIKDTDLLRLNALTSVSLSPDETKIAWTAERVDDKENKYYANIWIKDLRNGLTRRFTHGNWSDGKVVWSPDGTQFVFQSTREKKTGIYLMPVTGGAERKVIELEADLTDLNWTPDGKHLFFGMRYRDSHYIEDEKQKTEAPVFRHITRILYRFDGYGFLPKDRPQIYALNIETAKLRKITSGKYDNHSPAISRDGKTLVFLSNRTKRPDIDMLRDDLFLIPFAGGKEKKVPTPEGPKELPKFSPDGKLILYAGHDNPNDAWGVTNRHLWTVGVNGTPKAKDLMPGFDRFVMDQTIADLSDVHETTVHYWSGDGKRIYFLSSDDGITNAFYVPRSGGKPTRIFRGDCHLKGLSMNGRGKIAAMIWADLNNPGEIITCPAEYGGEKKVVRHTDMNPILRTEIKLGRTRKLKFKSFDGTEITGWLLTPPNFNPNRKYPAILEIHGGPRVQYGSTFFHEMQFLAANGHVVFYTNPRGGAGRGETWADAICGGWGDLDYKDCMAATDWMEKQKFIDKKRIGVTGGSYGGYMTNWIVGHTHRFKAAVTQRSVTELNSMFGNSDVGWDLEREFDGVPWTNPENYKKCSPLTYAKNVKTPLLIIHNERDLRCNIEQGEQLFTTLKFLGKTVEFVRFPEEFHGLSRHGRPDRRMARLNWILKWFKRYL